MARKVILAVAGAGKTYHICHNIDKNKKNLILAYTHENIKNIRKELFGAFGCIPELTTILTFDSFVYRYMVLPYESSILKFFDEEKFVTKSITYFDEPEPKIINGKTNPKYVKKEKIGHYINKKGFYYGKNISELITYIGEGKSRLIKKIATNINKFYDNILIDEFQDFREYDFDLITSLAKEVDNITLVGDYNQHSVSATNNSGKPFKNGKNDVLYDDFKSKIINLGFEVDENILRNSRRCPKDICDFINKKLKIKITHNNNNLGKVIFVKDNIENIIDDDSIVKLIYKEANKYNFKVVNWSYSKGDTFDSVCVILTDTFENIDDEEFFCDKLSKITINKLYVALTRTKGNLYIIKQSDFKKIKTKYINSQREY